MIYLGFSSPVTGPPNRGNEQINFRYSEMWFQKHDLQLLHKHRSAFRREVIELIDQEMVRAFAIYLCLEYIQISEGKEDDRILIYDTGAMKVKYKDVPFTLHRHLPGLWLEAYDESLQLGPIRYNVMQMEEPKDMDFTNNDNPFANTMRCKAVEHVFDHHPTRVPIVPHRHENIVPEQYVSTGVEHHAYRDGHPINSTNKGYKLQKEYVKKHIDASEYPMIVMRTILEFVPMAEKYWNEINELKTTLNLK